MKTDATPLGSTRQWDSALKQAGELASQSGVPSVIYHRPHDDKWFVRRADNPAPQGNTIKTAVYREEA
jgi:hypothetical protein